MNTHYEARIYFTDKPWIVLFKVIELPSTYRIEETLLQPVLKSFITVFVQCNVGLENKLARAPLLGLAEYIY